MPALLRGADIVQVQDRSNENEMRKRLPSSIAQENDHDTQVSSSRNAFVALRSAVSKPSVNQQKMGASRPRASLRRHFLRVQIAASALRRLDHLWVGSTKASWTA
jgi:hypothetical protein